jgi:hypothetical protein
MWRADSKGFVGQIDETEGAGALHLCAEAATDYTLAARFADVVVIASCANPAQTDDWLGFATVAFDASVNLICVDVAVPEGVVRDNFAIERVWDLTYLGKERVADGVEARAVDGGDFGVTDPHVRASIWADEAERVIV